jgi:hypothetical protein
MQSNLHLHIEYLLCTGAMRLHRYQKMSNDFKGLVGGTKLMQAVAQVEKA